MILLQNELDAIPLVRPSMRGIALVECSLDMPVRDDDPGVTYADVTTPHAPDQDRALLTQELMAALDRVLAKRTPQQARALRARLLGEATLEEAGDLIGVSRERIRQLAAVVITEILRELGLLDTIGRVRGPHCALRPGGVCRYCGKPTGSSRIRQCQACRDRDEATRAELRRRRREAGLCRCGRPLEDPGLISCRKCREAVRLRSLRRRAR